MKSAILCVNTSFDSLNDQRLCEHSFRSAASISLLDYDCIIIDTGFVAEQYKGSPPNSFENKTLLSEYASKQILEDFQKIKEQIVELLNQGKCIVLLVGENENCYIYTGETKYSGTGKNARRTNMVTELNVYQFLPIEISATHVYGANITPCCKQPYLDFFRKVDDCHQYAAYFVVPDAKPLAKIRGSSKVVSAVVECGKGKIIFLPQPLYEDEYTSVKTWKERGKLYLDSLFELCERVGLNGDDACLPPWADELYILEEEKELEKLQQSQIKAQKIQEEIEQQEAKVSDIQRYKSIITASGIQLEEIVKQVLLDIGFTLSDAERGRSDIVAQYKGQDIVAEIKGVSKSAAEKHAAQLEKWVAQFIEETGRIPKGILIVNGFCDLPLAKRTEEVFPEQMLKYCVARNHLLISTTQLLCLYIEIRTNPLCKKERLTELLETVGVYDHYKDVSVYIKPRCSTANTEAP